MRGFLKSSNYEASDSEMLSGAKHRSLLNRVESEQCLNVKRSQWSSLVGL